MVPEVIDIVECVLDGWVTIAVVKIEATSAVVNVAMLAPSVKVGDVVDYNICW
jgi:hypothetical protein